MSFIKDMIVKKVGEKAEDCVRDLLGIGSKDDDKDEGMFDFLGGGDDKKEKEKEKGGLFSFGRDEKKEEDKGGFFSNIFGKDDDDVQEKSGFHGLFSEQGADGDDRGREGETEGGSEERKGRSVEVNDGDLLQDLMEVADETSRKE